jgi:hypothetical protein
VSDKGPKELDPRWTSQVTEEMMAAVQAKASDNDKITCAVLRKYAEDTGVPYKVAGAAADMAGVRVENCDLGCF